MPQLKLTYPPQAHCRARLFTSLLPTTFFAIFFAISSSAFAYMEANFSAGYTRLSGAGTLAHPELAQIGAGLAVGVELEAIIIGVATDYRRLNQSVVRSSGNASGNRWNWVAPFLGFRYEHLTLKGNYQFLGNYNLSSPSLNGESVSYQRPQGWRADLLVHIYSKIHLGFFYESLSFTKMKVSSAETILATPLKVWQGGLSCALVY